MRSSVYIYTYIHILCVSVSVCLCVCVVCVCVCLSVCVCVCLGMAYTYIGYREVDMALVAADVGGHVPVDVAAKLGHIGIENYTNINKSKSDTYMTFA